MGVVRRWGSVVTVALLVGAAVPADAQSLLPQDDAGWGRDAPASFADGLPVSPGVTYDGTLELPRYAGPRYPVAGEAVDDEDWYRVHLSGGRLVTVELQSPNVDRRVVVAELRRPDATLAGWVSAEPARTGTRDVVTDVGGWWAVRVLARFPPVAHDAAVRYRFVVRDAAPDGFTAAAAGPGWMVVGVELHTGGSFQAEIWRTYPLATTVEREDIFVIEAPRRLRGGGISAPGLDAGVTVGGGCCRMDLRADVRDVGTVSSVYLPSEHGPGTFYVVLVHNAPEVYTYVRRLDVTGGRVLGVTVGGRDGLVAVGPGDFDSRAAASNRVVEVIVGGRASVHVRSLFVGSLFCTPFVGLARCAVRRPDGRTDHIDAWGPGPHALFVLDDPGTWTFTIDASVGALSWGYPVFGADVVLPGA